MGKYNVLTIARVAGGQYIELFNKDDVEIGDRVNKDRQIKIYDPQSLHKFTAKWYIYETGPNTVRIETIKYILDLGGHSVLEGEGKYLPLLYNPEVTGLKWNYVDTVTATLGGQYPIITRNGAQKYRTFTLGGMISQGLDMPFEMFDGYQFLSESELAEIKAAGGTDLFIDQVFKNRVAEWLQNGQPKIFISEQEGAMKVVLSNFSWTGNKTLGRYNYTFSCTATEVEALPLYEEITP